MKKYTLLLFAIALFSCSSDDNVKCGKVIATGYNEFYGNYVRVEGFENEYITVPSGSTYELGQNYCR